MEDELDMRIKSFTHDHYILELPEDQDDPFYRQFPYYSGCYTFRRIPLRVAPVIRIYGTNQYRQKCCCHVHGYFPSFYIKADEFAEAFQSMAFINSFLEELEGVFQQAYKVNEPVICKAETEIKYDFYGYHTRKECFLRIYVLNPSSIPKLRELLASKILNNKAFQCYQAHINYYMQLFSDLNIFGIHEMKVSGFTFRKNLNIMSLFQKFHGSLFEGLKNQGWDLLDLENKRPSLFNSLQKDSSCYVEIDFMFGAILNAYEDVLSDSDPEFESSDEDPDLMKSAKKMKVETTKALEEIWRDEKKRRSIHKIKKPLQGIIDYTKNIQNDEQVIHGNKDPLWINFFNKADNADRFIQMLRSYESSQPHPQIHRVEVSRAIKEDYNEVLTKQRDILIDKVQNRWKYYETRKNTIVQDIMNGDRNEMPEWEEEEVHRSFDNNSDLEAESQEVGSDYDAPMQIQREEEQETYKLSMSKQSQNRQEHRDRNTMALYRNNFEYKRANIKRSGYFDACPECRERVYECHCKHECCFCPSKQCFCGEPNQLPIEDPSQPIHYFQYVPMAPTAAQCMAKVGIETQKPFYSRVSDLLLHYKVSMQYFYPEKKIAQYLDKSLKYMATYQRDPISIKNSNKLPTFYQIAQNCSTYQTNIIPSTYYLQYSDPAPSYKSIRQQLASQKFPLEFQSTQPIDMKGQTFVSDLIVLKYQILTQVDENLFYSDPQRHPLQAIIYELSNYTAMDHKIIGVIMIEAPLEFSTQEFDEIMVVNNEYGLLSLFVSFIFKLDVDILISYDQQKRGIRYLTQRGVQLGINIPSLISRSVDLEQLFEHINFKDFYFAKESFLLREYMLYGNVTQQISKTVNRNNQHFLNLLNQKIKSNLRKKPVLRKKYNFSVDIKGRVNINLARICQNQLKLRSYTIQAVVFHLFGQQIPEFTDQAIWKIYKQSPSDALKYFKQKNLNCHRIIEELNIVGGIVEKSKVYGADFESMMERGSQFKIESVMCRTTRKNDLLTLSASKMQVAQQSVLECRPFVLQPPKQFFSEPVLLFDFQSLYPSVMIAYNLCYSTCLGSVNELFKEGRLKKLGVSTGVSMDLEEFIEIINNNPPHRARELLEKYIFVSPNRVAFLKKNIRTGFIPKILLEFLISRIMIKDSTKLYEKDNIKKLLKERQNALKLFMNVMYGYTGASFTGRMPCSQIADSVVEISKYCLTKSMQFLSNHSKYKGKIIYGDTDSIFFHVPGLDIQQALQAGKQLAEEMTKLFPYPMEMKFEKAYDGLVLVSKKRYYGKSYETVGSMPKYEGKGLECVRRDGIVATSELMSKMINTLIDSKDLSLVKRLFTEKYEDILAGKVLENELWLAKEIKLLKYQDKNCPAHGEAAKRLESIDPFLVPKYGERMKYVITTLNSKALKKRALSLFEFFMQKSAQLDYEYYAKKQLLPPFKRVFISLANPEEWILRQESSNLSKNNHYILSEEIEGYDLLSLSENNELKQPSIYGDINSCEHTKNNKNPNKTLICHGCLDQILKENRSQIKRLNQICKQCTSSCSTANIQQCIEFNCINLYRRRRAVMIEEKARSVITKVKKASLKLCKRGETIIEVDSQEQEMEI